MVELTNSDFEIARLGPYSIPTPMQSAQFVSDDERVLYHGTLGEIQGFLNSGEPPPTFEMAGPGERIFQARADATFVPGNEQVRMPRKPRSV